MKRIIGMAVCALALASGAAMAAEESSAGRDLSPGHAVRKAAPRVEPRAVAPRVQPRIVEPRRVEPRVERRPEPRRAEPRRSRPVIVFREAPSFPSWSRSFGYDERYHDVCQRKAWRLRWFERRAADDGYIDSWEREEMADLRRDLRRTCGDYRWR